MKDKKFQSPVRECYSSSTRRFTGERSQHYRLVMTKGAPVMNLGKMEAAKHHQCALSTTVEGKSVLLCCPCIRTNVRKRQMGEKDAPDNTHTLTQTKRPNSKSTLLPEQNHCQQ